jgi:hypothetical protein
LNNTTKTLYRRTVDNYATVNWTAGQWNAGFNCVWNNTGSGVLDIQGDLLLQYGGGGTQLTFNNSGILRKTSGAGTGTVEAILNNANLVSAQSGTLSLTAGGNQTGILNANAGCVLNYGGGTHNLLTGSSLIGAGLHRVNGGTFNVASLLTVGPSFELASPGTLDGTNTVIFVGPFTWSGGVMENSVGGGRTVFTNTATVTLNNTTKTLYRRTVDNYATVNWTAGQWNAGFNCVWNNTGSGVLDIQGDLLLQYGGGGTQLTFNNSGILRKTSGAGTASMNVIVTNYSAVSSQSGTLNFQSTYRQESGSTTLAGGSYQAVLLDINGGSLTGNGSIAGPVRNNGAIIPGNPLGFLSITNSANFTNTAGGTYFLQLGGANAGVNHDTIRVAGNAILGGSLVVSFTNGYVPPLGTVHTAMTFTARSGVFTNSNASLLGLVEVYTPTNFLLVASNGLPQVAFTVEAGPTQSVCRPFFLSAQAFDLDGTITNLAILLNGSPIAQTTNTTLETTLEIDFPATYSLEARAADDKGALAISNRPIELYAPLHVLTLGGVRDTNDFKLCMVGQTGSNYLVRATTNLTIPSSNWVDLGLMTYTNGIFRYFDKGTLTNRPARYYRALQQ